MTLPSIHHGILRRVSPGTGASSEYSLSTHAPTTLGRDRTCQIFLDPQQHQGVSRQHLEVRFLPSPTPGGQGTWKIRDLGSSNGTSVNGVAIHGEHTLKSSDRIKLGRNGPEFVFEYHQPSPRPVVRPLAQPPIDDSSLHLSQVIPILTTRQGLLKKAFLVPGIFTVLLVVGLFSTIGNPALFNALLALYLAGAAYYFVYQLSGKPKPWWLIVGMAIATILILLSPVLSLFILVFRDILPGNISDSNTSVLNTFVAMFFGAGLMEELLKALPVFFALWVGTHLKSPQREQIGVWEPLDGILLAAASAVGFTLLETLGQYVPGVVQSISAQAGEGTGQLLGLQLLIPRIIGSIAGHMAYSGYFGYFIGLSVMKRSKRWTILAIGWLTSSLLHALWNTVGGGLLGIVVGVVSYAFLMAAILKARQLSPTRHQNFATQYHPPGLP